MNCSYKLCYYYSRTNPQIQEELRHITLIPCPHCKSLYYCSEKHRIQDWDSGHKNSCLIQQNNMINQTNDLSDISHSLIGIRKCLADYEEVIGKSKTSDLGKGSYGSVKLVKEKKTGMLFAIKTMTKKSIFEYSSVENLKREIKIQKKLSHPHIVKLIHYFEDKENVYLILEYAENGSLFRYLRKKGKFTEYEAFVYFFQTCLGIDYLHKKNIIHRDLKPENLLLDKNGNVKLCDFGWSAESVVNKRTTFCGTIDYMAPEMIKNSPHDFKLDIWCLGVLLYELFHGNPPFKGKTENEKFKSILNNGTITFDDVITKLARDLIKGILKSNPNERLTMDEILHHPWMMQYEKSYKIKIDKYIWKEDTNASVLGPAIDIINRHDKKNNDFELMSGKLKENGFGAHEEKKDSFIVLKNIDNGKIINNSNPPQIDDAKYYANENAADSKRTYSQVMDLDKYLKEINADNANHKKDNRSKTQNNFSEENHFLQKDHRSKTQNLASFDGKQEPYYMNKKEKGEFREGREKDYGEKKLRIERARTKEPCLKEKNDENYGEKYLRKKRDLEKFLGDDDHLGNRTSKMSMKNRQINEGYNRKLFEEPKQDLSFFDKILTVFGCITRDKKKT